MGLNNPLVTIAIPVFNCEKTIQRTMRSVLSQTFSDFEVLVCDDGSTDETVKLIRDFNDPRVRIFQDGRNMGIAPRLNQLIDQARGEFFVRMDGDDLMFPDRLDRQVSFLRSHPDVDVVGAAAVIIDDEDQIIGIRGGEQDKDLTIDDLFASSRFIHPTVAGRTEWFRKWRYDEHLSGCEDMDLWLRGFANSKYADIQEPLLFYREYLNLRLPTYLRRKRTLCGYYLRNWRQMSGLMVLLRLLIKTLISSAISVVACLFGKSANLLRRRNRQLTPQQLECFLAKMNSLLK